MTAYVWRSVRATKIHLKLVWKQQNTIQANEQIAILRLTLPIDSYKSPLIFYIFQTKSMDVEQIEGILNRHGGTNHINRESVTTRIMTRNLSLAAPRPPSDGCDKPIWQFFARSATWREIYPPNTCKHHTCSTVHFVVWFVALRATKNTGKYKFRHTVIQISINLCV